MAKADFNGKEFNPLLERGGKYLWSITQSILLAKHNYQWSITSLQPLKFRKEQGTETQEIWFVIATQDTGQVTSPIGLICKRRDSE